MARLGCNFSGFCDSCRHPLSPGSQHKFGAISRKQQTPLDAHRIRHHKDGFITFRCRQHSQTHACIAAGRFNDCVARLQDSLFFRCRDHVQGDAILDAAADIERL